MRKFKKIPSIINLPFHTYASLKDRLTWFIHLRWIAVMGIFISVPVAKDMLGFVINYNHIIVISSSLLLINIFYYFINNYLNFKNEVQQLIFVEVQIVIDLFIISFLIHHSGGIGNPFYFIYIVHVILSGILFPGVILPYVNAGLAAVLLTIWTFLEWVNFVERVTLIKEFDSVPYLITALAAFYITNFAGIYIINTFMIGYRALKKLIDEKNDLLEKAITDRNKAFRFAAHELKAPMIAIQSTLAVVRDLYSADLKPELKEMVSKAESRSLQLINMIKDMITINQYNLGVEKPKLELVNFNDWLKQVFNLYKAYALQKNIKMSFIPSKEFFIEIDRTGIERVAGNLINNAIRYTRHKGNVTVEVLYDSGNFGFKVSDTGIGIEDTDLDKVFDEFFRGKNAKEMERIGTGLGLNLVKEIVEYNQGSIFVKSEYNKGSEFKILFPLTAQLEENEFEEEEENLFLHFE